MPRPCLLVLVLALAACGSTKTTRPRPAQDPHLEDVVFGGANPDSSFFDRLGARGRTENLIDVQATALGSARTLVRTATVALEVSSVDTAASEIERLATAAGGYVQSRRTSDAERGHVIVRVPPAALDATVDGLAALGEVTDREIEAEDVTDQLAEREARLANNKALRDRLRALLERATDVTDVLKVEEQLNRLQIAIDTEEGVLKRMREHVALAILNVDLERREILGPLGYLGYGLYWLGRKLFILSD